MISINDLPIREDEVQAQPKERLVLADYWDRWAGVQVSERPIRADCGDLASVDRATGLTVTLVQRIDL